MSLSLESDLQPSLHVSESLVRKADELFEREQEIVAQRAVAEERPQDATGMYINEHGYDYWFTFPLPCLILTI